MPEEEPTTVEGLMIEYELSRKEAERAIEDDDLWLLSYGSRYEKLVGEEAVEQWAQARDFAQGIGEMALDRGSVFGEAMAQLMLDAAARAGEAWRRAKRR